MRAVRRAADRRAVHVARRGFASKKQSTAATALTTREAIAIAIVAEVEQHSNLLVYSCTRTVVWQEQEQNTLEGWRCHEPRGAYEPPATRCAVQTDRARRAAAAATECS